MTDSNRVRYLASLARSAASAFAGSTAAGLPIGIQVCSDLWREDLCLEVAEFVEAGEAMPLPIDPAATRPT